MRIIDVDSHAEPASNWLDDFPSLKARLPERFPDTDPRFQIGSSEMFAFFVSDDLLRHVPVERRMSIDKLTTPAMRMMYSADRASGFGYEGATMNPEMVDPAGRVAWLDAQGIDNQALISGVGYTLARAISDPVLGRDTLSALNTWMSDAVEGHTDRLLPVANLRFDDLDWATAELERMRGRGSRTFLISSEPADGVPPNHPAFDSFWSAAEDLGMIAHLHIGMSPSLVHPGWANTEDPALIRVLSVLQPHQSAQVFLTALIFGGVFDRHPKLTVLISELGIAWLPQLAARLDGLAAPGVSQLLLDHRTLPQRPSEYIRAHVRISPLPTAHESPVSLFDALPDVAVFSSDYPHFEGSATPIDHYDKELAAVEAEMKASFLGESIATAFARMGDPL